ncbi:MAG: cysteine hydrolase [Syntrophobacteraceae bacterium]|nr:cysteine hydrolase [Syntrophobacteraceae bacterium]
MERKALLIIDMLNDFMDPRGALYCGDEGRGIIPVIQSLVHQFTRDGHPVIYLRDAHRPDDLEFDRYPAHAVRGTWGSQIIPELDPPTGCRVIDKTRYSAFYGTELEDVLAECRPEEVWVTGVVTSICVMDTAGDLVNRDYHVIIPVDAVADFDPEFGDFALRRMERVYKAKIVRAPLAEAEATVLG